MDRADLPEVISTFTKAFGRLAGRTSDRKVQKMYKAAEKERPADITSPDPSKGVGASQAYDGEYPMFP